MSIALEEFSQNASLSLLSGQIILSNPGVPKLLQSTTKTCTYTFTAYQYTPYRLFLTYGVAVFVTLLCAFWDRSRSDVTASRSPWTSHESFGRSLNERLYYAKERTDMNTRLKADETVKGELVPSLFVEGDLGCGGGIFEKV